MSNPAAIKFAYDHLAYYLHDGDYDPAGKTHYALTKRQPISTRAGDIRLGAMGDGLHMAVITESKTVLKADIKPSRPLPDSIEFKPATWRSNPAWRADIMTHPPQEPFMVIVFDKSTDYVDSLRLSSSDVLFECGPRPRVYNLALIRRGLATFDSVDPAVMFDAKRLLDLRLRQSGSARFVDEKMAAIKETCADIFELCGEFPEVNTAEFDAIRMIVNVRARQGKA